MRTLSRLKLFQASKDQLAAMRADVRAHCDDRPGVYRMLAPDGEIVYVGKSKRIRTRLLSYFRCGPDEKGARIIREAGRVEWDYTPSEFSALLEELRAKGEVRVIHGNKGQNTRINSQEYTRLSLPSPEAACRRR